MIAAANEAASGFTVRAMLPAEASFVEDSWVRSFAKSAPNMLALVGELREDAYRAAQRVVAQRLIRRGAVLVAHLPSVPDEACGYLVLELHGSMLVLHWLYVKQPYRKLGAARLLLGAALRLEHRELAHTHESAVGRELAKKLRSRLRPYLARRT